MPLLNRVFLPRTAMQAALAAAALMTIGALDVTPASAQGAWCANYSGRSGGATNCGFYTFEQCRAAVSGVGGYCSPSPYVYYGGEAPIPPRKLRRQYR
jgi:hypothetical protein